MAEIGPRQWPALETKLAQLAAKRTREAHDHFATRAQAALVDWTGAGTPSDAAAAAPPWHEAASYWIDFAQRTILFWDTMRQRGNQWLEHEKAGKPPLLHFKYETIADARHFSPPVNYALLRIIPPDGVTIDPKKRPFVIIDPRAGHGPGIGGFKQDSEVGEALAAGHPVYFVVFFPEPEPGQTLADVSRAEAEFLRIVRRRHPDTGKPVVIGNCQGGWAAMLIGALDPDLPGPIVVNGAPMSYWAGNDGENPMRYSGGILGGTWLSLLVSDLGGGIFDGAYLVDNFENLNPANTLVDKYYTLFSKVDTEPPRFLEFEKWWGGYFLMNRAEIKWIVENLFVGNKLAAGEAEWSEGRAFDLRSIRSPIVVFASLGDNITPPQQAINWVADLYETTEDLKANGQVIVGLMHETVGHLGIFVSGGIAKREHSQIVRVLDYIETLPPGLYGMKIEEHHGKDGTVSYDVTLTERRVEDLRKLQAFERKDEIPFSAVAAVSDAGQTFYESVVHPWLAPMVPPAAAEVMRFFHPLRMQRWAFSDLNPAMAWLKPAAEAIKAARAPRDPHGDGARTERAAVAMTSALFDLYRELRDATAEQLFFQIYGTLTLAAPGLSGSAAEKETGAERTREAVQAAMARIESGGLREGFIRTAMLLSRAGTGRRRLSSMQRARELLREDARFGTVTAEQLRPTIIEQSIIVDEAPERALATLPVLFSAEDDRGLMLSTLDRLEGHLDLNADQHELLSRVRALLTTETAAPRATPRIAPSAKQPGRLAVGRRQTGARA
jgi:pimeloyl-ACP methyl ester carboxylesterase